MSKKRILISAVVIALVAALAYLQFRTWRKFDWGIFWQQTSQARLLPMVVAVLCIYLADALRGLRWKLFLRPVCKASAWQLIPPQFIGFAGLALLGRPGEFIRPYLIARKQNLTFSSQMAVWAVERIFDMAAFTVLVAIAIFAAPSLRELPYFDQFREAGFVLIGVVVLLTLFAIVMRRKSPAVACWLERRLQRRAPILARHISHRAQSFGEGLNTIHDAVSFVQLVLLSMVIWLLVALAYLQVAHAYPPPLAHLEISHVLLLLGFTMVGAVAQLPAIGGGAQLMSIAALANVFSVPSELAVSCGMLLWVVTFIAVVPLGLALARREQVSLRQLSRESHEEEVAEESVVTPVPRRA